MQLTPEEKLILSCIKIHPGPSELEKINNLIPLIQDWEYLTATIIDRGIAPLFYKKLPLLTNSSQIPEAVRTKLQQAWYKTFSRSTVLYEHFRKIAEAFTSQNIQVIALKGIYLSEWLYQDIGLRQFSDIDLLLKEEDAANCLIILEGLGYIPYKIELSSFVLSQFAKDIVHYPPRMKDGVSIELHIKLHSKNQSYNVLIPTLWANAIPATINGILVLALNNRDLLIHLCLHLDKHFRVGHVQFTCFNDITNLLERDADILNWEKLTETCRLYHCEETVYLIILMIHTYMSAAVPLAILEKYGYLLTHKDKELFIKYLRGYDGVAAAITLSGHFGYLKDLATFSEKVRYLWGVLFPSRAFMIQVYKIKKPTQVLFYYPYRYYIGMKGVVNHLKKLIVNSRENRFVL